MTRSTVGAYPICVRPRIDDSYAMDRYAQHDRTSGSRTQTDTGRRFLDCPFLSSVLRLASWSRTLVAGASLAGVPRCAICTATVRSRQSASSGRREPPCPASYIPVMWAYLSSKLASIFSRASLPHSGVDCGSLRRTSVDISTHATYWAYMRPAGDRPSAFPDRPVFRHRS